MGTGRDIKHGARHLVEEKDIPLKKKSDTLKVEFLVQIVNSKEIQKRKEISLHLSVLCPPFLTPPLFLYLEQMVTFLLMVRGHRGGEG